MERRDAVLLLRLRLDCLGIRSLSSVDAGSSLQVRHQYTFSSQAGNASGAVYFSGPARHCCAEQTGAA